MTLDTHDVTYAVGLDRLQQLFDALTEEGQVIRTHVYRVLDGNDAHETLTRIDAQRKNDHKRILLDLPTKECELLLQKQVMIAVVIRLLQEGLADANGSARQR